MAESLTEPARALLLALEELYIAADEPSCRTIADRISRRVRELPPGSGERVTLSHNTVNKVLRAPHLGSQQHLLAVVACLHGAEVARFQELWIAARKAEPKNTRQAAQTGRAAAAAAQSTAEGDGRLGLAEEFFLVNHDRDGDAYIGESSLGLGVAGAILIELAQAGLITVGERVVVDDSADRTGHPYAVFADLIATADPERRDQQLWRWVRDLQAEALRQVSQRLEDAGLVTPEDSRSPLRWLGRKLRYRPSADPAAGAPASSLRRVLTRVEAEDVPTVILAALVDVTEGHECILVKLPRAQMRQRIEGLAATLPPWTREVVAAVDRAIAERAIKPLP
ncbi:GPP34 family phosphoprotein [Catellatospora bangladeshensis]|uniref:Uncharacterized protein n=1 Tax=Catellatospora bangladeshensis TaxID=310355 RepID=A0A8J3JQA0_9ACTN|nr:GPP34 family phosphoprotein [Catellatospora bangladeshensis]GIF81294.1 hypothetical protein Cba03nite_26430 [Catellatospora bangladeshensis]